ncbi:MAG: tetraacyldisaccharide 4'-kinase [Psittacicella sp.]
MEFWYKKYNILSLILLPFSILFRLVTFIRRFLYKAHFIKSFKSQTPIVIVGNISIGGSGKTPMIITLSKLLEDRGLRVGVISKGYKSNLKYPTLLNSTHSSFDVGDEPYLIYKSLNIPVAIAKDRFEAVKLLEPLKLDLILSDDGLQHYKLSRSYELIMIDSIKGLGNKRTLPAGPLREGVWRLQTANNYVLKGNKNLKDLQSPYRLSYKIKNFINPSSKLKVQSSYFINKKIIAIAGIANPTDFFNLLKKSGLEIMECKNILDHKRLSKNELISLGLNKTLIMTEKDAVKYLDIWQDNWFYTTLKTDLSSSQDLITHILTTLKIDYEK